MKEILYAVLVLGVLGAVFGGILAFASKIFAVKTDERLPVLVDALPGANCGGCGFAGCQAYAQAVLEGKADIGLCAAGGPDAAGKMAAIMGVEQVAVERKVAMVKCCGENHLQKGVYQGIHDCQSAFLVAGNGPSACPNGCLGFGSCVSVCKFGAISVVNGVARIDAEKCTGCMQCVDACPRRVIVPVTYHTDIVIACSNRDRGANTRHVCSIGCIGCHLCERNCEYGAIHVVNNLATIDYDKCVSCGKCAAICPRHLISDSNLRTDMDAVPAQVH